MTKYVLVTLKSTLEGGSKGGRDAKREAGRQVMNKTCVCVYIYI